MTSAANVTLNLRVRTLIAVCLSGWSLSWLVDWLVPSGLGHTDLCVAEAQVLYRRTQRNFGTTYYGTVRAYGAAARPLRLERWPTGSPPTTVTTAST
jgi:hypothetical protein